MSVDADTRRAVADRAGDRCEYCRIPGHALDLNLHVEHVRAKQHGGNDTADNLALACDRCNLRKGPNLTGIDPQTDRITPLFNPRLQQWGEHFDVVGAEVAGRTAEGRTTVNLLDMNASRRLQLRRVLVTLREWP